MLVTISSELQKSFENLGAFNLNEHLKDMFQEQARTERFKVIQSILGCKQHEGFSVSTHVLKLKGYFDILEFHGFPFT